MAGRKLKPLSNTASVFARKLERIVEAYGSIAAASKVLGCDADVLRSWRNGKEPEMSSVRALAETSGISVAYWADDGVEVMSEAEARDYSSRVSELSNGGSPGGEVHYLTRSEAEAISRHIAVVTQILAVMREAQGKLSEKAGLEGEILGVQERLAAYLAGEG